jgi:phospholipid/cholesterol/gamma-HCH transport system ATP-binding protein
LTLREVIVRPDGSASLEPLIAVRELHKQFGGDKVLDGVSLFVPSGQSVVVMGASGAGKSVFLKHLVQLLKPDHGEVWMLGKRIDQLTGEALNAVRLSVGYLFQGGALFDSMRVYENLSFLLERHSPLSKPERDTHIRKALAWVNLEHTADQYPAELSGGQRTRIALARSVVLQPQIMLYDEPTTGLDPVSVRRVSGLIRRLQAEQGVTSITITHDQLCTEIVADKVYFLDRGRFVAHGTLDEVRQSKHPSVQSFFGFSNHASNDSV